ncbi:alpha,alpha-trehalose-phosphate synthase (UDP-forming) [Acidocella aminolytica]|uniref:Alpha,alpha-trehalose-phosphate synthase n=1 Tax=Acidocella aminolytica 101 = DSM 11237 TaxID=1120923 RepID=A0A0D6PJ50_9PROT|nr:trehalose-6-phosphate synthase [Acidocella aminolytica]GAN80849.1 alpha,alpha-trehalose-phosphate synthase [Acidocella aminolytica 101 = DSM 11237]GBQ32586.1 alpha,alpha-trehalose-phosphate synthase [Acidocella aminolytica 101 = DSM 11237]SHE31867.1 trehalose 6-phosphate synthase [Acidocella aminolytica 101 = DSM 11237]
MARLVIVSNRVPDVSDGSAPRAGGLVVGLADALKPGSLWFGWSGRQNQGRSETVHSMEAAGVTYATIDLAEPDYRAYYLGFSNSTLWPLFHMMPSYVTFDRAEYAAYKAVNEQFAQALTCLLQPDDLVWIHDYQLLGVAAALRKLGVRNRIGFFLHIPFPAPALFALLPPADELLEALLAHDLLGFQTAQDQEHFLAALLAHGIAAQDGEVRRGGSVTRSIVVPVGIDVEEFRRLAGRAVRRVEARRMVESLAGRALMISADRADYTKGLPARFDAYERFLASYPEQRRRISFLQVAAPSREEVEKYKILRDELDYKAGAINGKFSDFDWVPLRYITRAAGRGLLAGLFRVSRIGLVTPLRDGMNLVGMEYIAAQEEVDPGVLILSRFAGAAGLLPEALQVNPYDIDMVAAAINTAMSMSLEERKERHAALLAHARTHDASAYSRSFIAELNRAL